jgi:hypothetical protein
VVHPYILDPESGIAAVLTATPADNEDDEDEDSSALRLDSSSLYPQNRVHSVPEIHDVLALPAPPTDGSDESGVGDKSISSNDPLPLTMSSSSHNAQNPAVDYDDLPDSQGTVLFTAQEQRLRFARISDTSGYYSGRLILISDDENDGAIRGCAMIILKVSDHGFPQCLMLCRHHGMDGDDEERLFWEAHSVVCAVTVKPRDAYVRGQPNPPIMVQLSNPSTTRLVDNCFVNYQHTWTLRKDVVKAMVVGKVQGEDLKKVMECYKRVQNLMYEKMGV